MVIFEKLGIGMQITSVELETLKWTFKLYQLGHDIRLTTELHPGYQMTESFDFIYTSKQKHFYQKYTFTIFLV